MGSFLYGPSWLDEAMPPREKVIELMAQDHTLIRRPIIRTIRLLTVGCDKRKITEMLQINANGTGQREDPGSIGNRRPRNNREVAPSASK